MKPMKQFMSLIIALVAVVSGIAADFRMNPSAALYKPASTVPATVENGDTVGAGGASRAAAPAGDLTTQYNITLHPFEGVPKFNSSFPALAANAITAVSVNGELPMGSPTSLTDARLIDHIKWDSLMTTPAGVSYWAGFNPTGAFTGANGKTVWMIVRVKSKTGINDASLATVSAAMRSQDFGNNSLGLDVGFISNSYTTLAPGWRADGGMVTSGSSSQAVSELMVVVGFKSYEVTNSSDVSAVQNYVTGNFAITFTANAGASTATKTLSLVAPRPTLVAKVVGGVPGFELLNNRNPDSFELEFANEITGPWTKHPSTVKAGDRIQFPVGDIKFARYYQP